MKRTYSLDVDRIVEEDGSGIGYVTKGHHAPQDFIDDLRAAWDEDAYPGDVRQSYWRILPPDAEGFKSYQQSKPGRGAFPVTYTYDAFDYFEAEPEGE